MNNLLEIKNVVKTYGDFTALNNVSLTIPRGSVFGLLGPNGARLNYGHLLQTEYSNR